MSAHITPILGCILIVCIIQTSDLRAGDFPEPMPRPKIGLVLGGGGARGLAHVGVLNVLKELRIPVDYIAGTSMGAIAGGLFAAGMSVEEIETLTRTLDWRDVLNDKPSRDYRSFRRKEEDNLNLMGFEVGFNDGKIFFPRGLIAGQKLSFVLRTQTLAVAGISDFDKLPIPFRAVATNIENGEMVILANGNLPSAMRASMSVPSVFSPVEINGMILVDGALVDNVPVDVVRAMGADIIIAVDVGEPLLKRDELSSIMGITVQVFNVLTQKRVDEQVATLNEKDVLIRPELGDIGSSDFMRFAESIRIGEEAARSAAESLSRYSVSIEEYAAFLNMKNARTLQSMQIDYIQLGGDLRNDRRVYHRLKTSLGRPLDLAQLRKDINDIYELGDYEQVDFNLLEESGHYALQINGRRKSWGPNYLRFGLVMSMDLEGAGSVNVLTLYRMTKLNTRGAEWKHLLRIGDFPKYETEFYQPLHHHGIFFVAPSFSAEKFQANVFSPQSPDAMATYSAYQFRIGSDLGIAISNSVEGRIGLARTYGQASATVGSNLPDVTIRGAGILARLQFDNLDDPNFPKFGSSSIVQYYSSRKSLGADSNYRGLRLGYLKTLTAGKHTWILSLEGGSSLGSRLPVYDQWMLGGFLHLSAYNPRQITGDRYLYGSAIYMFHLAKSSSPYSEGIYAGLVAETGNAWNTNQSISTNDLKYSYSILLGIDTIVGPLYLGCSFSDTFTKKYYVNLGRTF